MRFWPKTVIARLVAYFLTLLVVDVALSALISYQLVRDGAPAPTRQLVTNALLVSLLIAFALALTVFLLARRIANPILDISRAASQIAEGNLDLTIPVQTDDEIGALAKTFNAMAERLRNSVGQLEKKVAERTLDLSRRHIQIEAAVEIGHTVTSTRDITSLINLTVRLISERFGYYHAGVFLLDETGKYAVLEASNSDGGRKMLERGHRLKVGETGIVGYVTQTGKARIALDVGQDAVFFDNPDLPETRSELTLPLTVSGQILGALDVQSTEPEAFSEEDIATLQIVADQVAIAIQNAQLFKDAQNALENARVAFGEISRTAWEKIIKSRTRINYTANSSGAVQINPAEPNKDLMKAVETGDVVVSADSLTISVPIKIRGKSIGALRLKKTDTSNSWSPEEINLTVALAEQLSGALDSARLYKESQQRAARESLVSEISAHISALPRVDTIVRETVQELGEAIGDAKITFSLLSAFDKPEQIEGPRGNGSDPDPSSQPRKSRT